jgi:phospho-N-acetylmuramoyl-pentapeptide-transferase
MSQMLSPLEIALIPAAALVLVAALGPLAIRLLKRAGAGQRVREDGPRRHLEKAGTPTMGGVLLLGAAVAASLAAQRWTGGAVTLRVMTLLAVLLAFGCIGAADDWMKITRGRSLGLRARHKVVLQLVVAVVFVYALAGERAAAAVGGNPEVEPLGPVWAGFWALALVATSNAVNLADGLDGLAAGLCAIGAAGFAVLALKAGDRETGIVALAVAGACAGFLAYNHHPAKMFMGDVGSLALGGALAAVAAHLNQPVALVGLCLIPFVEELSVIVQVISFKATGRRVLRMSPLHHHFELSGWPERRVVVAFWATGLIAAAAVLALCLMT